MSILCARCGATLEPGTKFCITCGAKAEDAGLVDAAAPPWSQPGVSQAAAAVAPELSAQPRELAGSQGQSASAQPSPEPAKNQPRAEKEVKSIGFFWSLGYLLLLNIPVLGLILSIVWGLRTSPKNRSNLARAMIFIHLIWIAVLVLIFMWLYPILHQLTQAGAFSIKIFGYELR
ncbi:MAG: hypothetical protein FWC60_04390 [Firmicutes bacterium]|nr:hypothetical protein [Bacillota bacterium]